MIAPRIYFAAPFAEQQRVLKIALSLGHCCTITSRWLGQLDPDSTLDRERGAKHAQDDLEDIRNSDIMLLFTDARSLTGGKHFEAGYAHALGIPVIICGEPENVFHHLLERIGHPTELEEFLNQRRDRAISVDVNARQVGGEHYRSAIQHWDWVVANDLGYLEGQVTKYIARHGKKGGPADDLQDLEKAKHYLEKLIEVTKVKHRK